MFAIRSSCALILASLPLLATGLASQDDRKASKTPASAKELPSLYDARGRVIGGVAGGVGGKFGGRAMGRSRLVATRPPIAQCIADGLTWLSKHQDRDGGWDAAGFMRHDKSGRKSDGPGEGIGRVGITGFCLLPFLGDGSTLVGGEFGDVVRDGVDFLRRRQAESGAYSKSLLEHAVATYAITEAAGLSRSTVLSKEASLALAYLASQQNTDGGFSFRGKGKPSDAYTTFQGVMAYRGGLDFGLIEDRSILKAVDSWLGDSKRAIATPAPIALGVRSKESVQAVKLLVSFFVGRKKSEEMRNLADSIFAHLPSAKSSEADPVFLHIATSGLYQMGAPYWGRWSRPITSHIVENQRRDGNFAGSWNPMGPGAVLGGRVYTTALFVLTAETYFRYTRLVR